MAKDQRAQLRDKITEALMRDVGVSERMAQPFVDSILRCFAGERAYFPAEVRDYPVALIRESLERGESVKRVMRAFDISRSKLHQIFPGGLPKSTREDGLSTVLPKSETK